MSLWTFLFSWLCLSVLAVSVFRLFLGPRDEGQGSFQRNAEAYRQLIEEEREAGEAAALWRAWRAARGGIDDSREPRP